MTERTLAVIKPHVFQDSGGNEVLVIADIQTKCLSSGLKIVAVKSFRMTLDFIKSFYAAHKDKPFFKEDIIPNMVRGISFAMILEGKDAIQKVRELNGATNPLEAEVNTLRYRYGRMEKGPNNGIHASDSSESYQREKELIFQS